MSSDQVLSDAAIAAELKTLPHWRHENGVLARDVATHGWPATLMVVNAIGHVAEKQWHHPDLAVSFDKVGITLSTHSAGGITGNDVALARAIESFVLTPPDPRPKNKYIKYDAA